MRAEDLVEDYPAVAVTAPAVEAVRTLAAGRLPGVVVLDAQGAPLAVLPGSQVLRWLVPGYVQEDPSLAGVYDEAAAERIARQLRGRTVGDLLPHGSRPPELPVVDADATVLECAAVMARLRSPLLVVRDGGGMRGAVTASRLLQGLFG